MTPRVKVSLAKHPDLKWLIHHMVPWAPSWWTPCNNW